MSRELFKCIYVDRKSDGSAATVAERPLTDLPECDTLIQVQWSSLNYKDALAATGHPGVAGSLPHVPGIDAAGTILKAPADSGLREGQEVLVTGYELGARHWGGWSEFVSVPSDWVVPAPAGLTLRETMMIGTAGFTAAQCVREIVRNEVTPELGKIVVTGATGGVGCLAVKILSGLGYQVSAVTGKENAHDWLKGLGAHEVLDRSEVEQEISKPLLPIRWAGAVDTVGGKTLSNLIRATNVNGCISACGMVGGTELNETVFPFILRGVRLAGITSSLCSMKARLKVWENLAGPWRLNDLDSLTTEVGMNELPSKVKEILAGQIRGRVVVRIA